jgi:acetyl esterase/lipase
MALSSAVRVTPPSSHCFGKAGLAAVLVAAALAQGGPPRAATAGPPPETQQVEAVRDITYYHVCDDPDADRHRLDVYRPTGRGPYPVLLFLHGGAWVAGDKDEVFGVYGYGTIARGLAERGLVVVLPNYRLSPGVRHPEHVKDVARAFAWAFRHCGEYGGDPHRLFVGGHSAGGHLAALLAADETYLKQVGRAGKDIRGVIGVSGVYRVDDFDLHLRLSSPCGSTRLSLDVRPLAVVFGDDPEVLRQASPLTHVRPGLPPFLILSAGWEYPPLRRRAKEFAAALHKNGCDVREREIPRRTHETLLFDIPRLAIDRAAAEEIVAFINRQGPKSVRENAGEE